MPTETEQLTTPHQRYLHTAELLYINKQNIVFLNKRFILQFIDIITCTLCDCQSKNKI